MRRRKLATARHLPGFEGSFGRLDCHSIQLCTLPYQLFARSMWPKVNPAYTFTCGNRTESPKKPARNWKNITTLTIASYLYPVRRYSSLHSQFCSSTASSWDPPMPTENREDDADTILEALTRVRRQRRRSSKKEGQASEIQGSNRPKGISR